MNKVIIETLGCRLNQIESESIARFFIDNGFEVLMSGVSAQTASDDSVISCVLNTCTVTQKAEQKARRIIRLLLKKYPNAVLIITGCYAQVAQKEISSIDKRICVIGGQVKSRIASIPAIFSSLLKEGEWNAIQSVEKIQQQILERPVEKVGFPEESFKLATSSFLAHSRASLKIQDGCNNSCSYCAIHLARGHSVSIDVKTAEERVQQLEAEGHSEVVITTVNIAQYRGRYEDKFYNISQLLEHLLKVTKSINFRISSLYPEVVDDDFCRVISSPRIVPHFHISVQSGSDSVLRAMNRAYQASAVLEACNKLKAVKNNPFLACDIITGFPGETKEDFEKTYELCEKCGFAWIHAFPFSERPGTPACSMKNKVPQSVSGERAARLTQWAINSKINYVNQFVGKELSAVLETVRKPAALSASQFIYHAVTENFIHCEIHSNVLLQENKKVFIKITKVLDERIVKGGEIEASAQLVKMLT